MPKEFWRDINQNLVKGHKKKDGVYYEEKFAPVAVYQDQCKHIGSRFYFIREYVDKKEIEPTYVKTQDQIANIFTKPLKFEDFRRLRARLSMKKKTSNWGSVQ